MINKKHINNIDTLSEEEYFKKPGASYTTYSLLKDFEVEYKTLQAKKIKKQIKTRINLSNIELMLIDLNHEIKTLNNQNLEIER